ncbi:MAG: lactam utilization protein LamB [Bacteroidetes bacterium GWF2_40_14]|nr:MAG: lactam utilization protein LamB [Bacteroidetes bacterium GWF2_40_14]
MKIDINCDMGESYGDIIVGNDEAIMPYITSANIACGFHGGDPLTIEKTILLALKHGVAIGAHPGYHDLKGFGRQPMTLTPGELRTSILYQVGALKSMTIALGGRLRHVKPHGAMYNSAASDFDMAMVIAKAVRDIDSSLILVGLSQSELINAAKKVGLAYASEVFADRAYNDDGSLVSRNLPGAVIHDTKVLIDRVIRMVRENVVESVSGKIIPIQADTICIHGDNEMAVEFVRGFRQ